MFNIIFSRPVDSANIVQISDDLFRADFFEGNRLVNSNTYPIYSNEVSCRLEDPEMVFAREQWNNLL